MSPRWMLLKIETDAGIAGWREPIIEGRARAVETAAQEFAPYLIGLDPARISDLWQVMYRGGFYRGGPMLMSAIAGIDQALWNIMGKALGVPVYQLLGGLLRDRMKGYSWGGGDRPADAIPDSLKSTGKPLSSWLSGIVGSSCLRTRIESQLLLPLRITYEFLTAAVTSISTLYSG